MTDTFLINCETVRGTFRQWQAEQAPIAAQLSESLSALSAYQSHLDIWQRQLAEERDELGAVRAELERKCATGNEGFASEATNELSAAHEEIGTLRASLDASAAKLLTLRDQLQQEEATAELERTRVMELTVELSGARSEIAALTKNLLASSEELRAERQRGERDESTAGYQQARLADISAELNAARDKISALTTMLLSRTDELRTLDVRRAEISTELELARMRERELKAALEELRQTREWEHTQMADESRHLRELVERRLESVDSDYDFDRAENDQAIDRHESRSGDQGADNPVFASVMQQFGKLREQRAMERPASRKGKVS